MKFDMFTITDYAAWGVLVKTWANTPALRPKSLDDFKAQVLKADPTAEFPDRYTDLQMPQASSTDPVLRITLPPADLLKEAEDDLKLPAGIYPLPDFYPDRMFNPN